jgi:hypothetical protein
VHRVRFSATCSFFEVRDRIVMLDTGMDKSTAFGVSTSGNRDGYRQRLSDLFR